MIIKIIKKISHNIKDCIKYTYRYFVYLSKYDDLKFYYSTIIYDGALFEGANALGRNVRFEGKLGYGSYIGDNSNISADIGRFTSIAPNVHINRGFHPIKAPFATTCPMFYSVKCQNGHTFVNTQKFNEVKPMVQIGSDCWIGQNVFIAGGVKIGDGAVVLAGSIVYKDIPPYAIFGGNKILENRYTDEEISCLLSNPWFKKDIYWLSLHSDLLCNLPQLLKYIKNNYA